MFGTAMEIARMPGKGWSWSMPSCFPRFWCSSSQPWWPRNPAIPPSPGWPSWAPVR